MARKRYNNLAGTITDNPLTSGATVFNSAALASMPVVTAPDIVAVVLDPGVAAMEIVYITNHTASATSATIQRAREGTIAAAHNTAAVWRHGPTVQDFEDQLTDGVTLEVFAGQHRVKDLGVTTAKIANNAVTAAQLAVGAVNPAALAGSAVTAPALAAGAVTTPAIAANAITQPAMADNSVGTAELINGSVTAAKLDPLAGVPSGCIMAFAGPSAPSGWVLCDGTAISRATFATLFGVIGTSYGVGDGTTTFNVPNFAGRVVVGAGATTGLTPNLTAARGDLLGEVQHILVVTEMPSHTHLQNAHTHTQNSHNHTQDAHNHTQDAHRHDPGAGTHFVNFEGQGNSGLSLATSGTQSLHTDYATATNNAATATNNAVTATNQNATATNQTAGGDQPHNNLQPYGVANYIIKL